MKFHVGFSKLPFLARTTQRKSLKTYLNARSDLSRFGWKMNGKKNDNQIDELETRDVPE